MYGDSIGHVRFDLDPGFKVTAAIGQLKWSVEAYLSKIGNINLLAMNRKTHMGNPMVASDLTLTHISRSQQPMDN